MRWGLAVLTLVVVAYVCRRILHMDSPGPSHRSLTRLSPEREEIYQPVAHEIETQTAILGVALNDALGERGSGDGDNAWRLVRLAACQWDRVAEKTITVLNVITDNLPFAQPMVNVRNVNASRFRSSAMIDFAGIQEALDHSVFRSKMRYQIHIRVLRRAVETLTLEFRRSFRAAEKMQEARPEMWVSLDPAFHDLDLITKESLLAFRGLLIAFPDAALTALSSDVKSVIEQNAQSKSVVTPPARRT